MISSHGCVGCRVVISVDFYCCPTPGSAGLVPCWAARRTAQTVCVAGWCSMPNHRCRCTGTKPVMFVCLYSYLTTECFRCMDISTIVSTMGPPVTGPPFPCSHTQWYERCVCVNHLNRCKTSFCGNFPGFGWYEVSNCRGTIHVLWAMVQRSDHSTCGYHGRSPWRTCFILSCHFPWWDVANPEPPCRFQTTWFSISSFARFSQSEFSADYFRWNSCL